MLIAACSDDECATCPQSNQTGIISGYLWVEDELLHMSADIVGMDGRLPDVDSVTVSGQRAYLEVRNSSGVPTIEITFNEDDMILGAAAKPTVLDSIPIRVYTPGGVSTAYGKALEYPDDHLQVIAPDTTVSTTVAINDPIELVWHQSDAFDSYAIVYFYAYDSAGTPGFIGNEYYWMVGDTTFTISGDNTGFDGFYSFEIIGATGPNPGDDVGSFTGGTIRGVIASTSHRYVNVTVGAGL